MVIIIKCEVTVRPSWRHEEINRNINSPLYKSLNKKLLKDNMDNEDYSRNAGQRDIYNKYQETITSIYNLIPETRDIILGDLEELLKKIRPRNQKDSKSKKIELHNKNG